MATSIVTGLTKTATDVTGMMTDLIPVALGVFALQWGIRKGIKFFKSSTN